MKILRDGVFHGSRIIYLCPACSCKFEAAFNDGDILIENISMPLGWEKEFHASCPQCKCDCSNDDIVEKLK